MTATISTALLLITTLFLTTACNQFAGKWSDSKDAYAPLSANEAAIKLNYVYVKSNILDKYCTSCHGSEGGINLESLDAIRKNSQKILTVMSDKSMPRSSPSVPGDMSDSGATDFIRLDQSRSSHRERHCSSPLSTVFSR